MAEQKYALLDTDFISKLHIKRSYFRDAGLYIAKIYEEIKADFSYWVLPDLAIQ